MKIASWNVNSIRQRGALVADWLDRVSPDLLFLQEIKCETEAFPAEAFTARGYRTAVVGQKAYHGVAVLARVPFTVTATALPGMVPEDAPSGVVEARYIEVETASPAGPITLGGLYLPNGNSAGAPGFAHKLRWMDRLAERAAALLGSGRDMALLGDFNVCPEDRDFAPGALQPGDALLAPEVRAQFRRLIWLGLTDAVRTLHPDTPCYSFWDYQAGCWPRDRGLRIDHALLSPVLAERLLEALPDRAERDRAQPSDHVPVLVTLADP